MELTAGKKTKNNINIAYYGNQRRYYGLQKK